MAEFSEMTVGYNFRGAQEYLNELNADMIVKTKDLIRGSEFTKVKNIIEECWVGQSEINFMNKFKKATEDLCDALDAMSEAVDDMMGAIEDEMVQRDKNIVDEMI